MYDFGLSVLEQYGLEAKASYRGRGALIVETQQGQKIIKEFKGSEKKLIGQRQIQCQLRENSKIRVDCLMENLDGEVVSKDRDGIPYTVRDWYAGRECDVKSEADIMDSMKMLAQIHKVLQLKIEDCLPKESLLNEWIRHNREIHRMRTYLKRKKKKNDFERCLLDIIDRFEKRAEDAVFALEQSDHQYLWKAAYDKGCICHGDCNQHNVLFVQGSPMLINYDHWNYDCQTSDLFLLMRKILEKNNWNIQLGQDMMEAYQKERPLSEEEVWNLKIRLSYPWKFWKLVNHYASGRKTWLVQRNMEKLEILLKQEKAWIAFSDHVMKER